MCDRFNKSELAVASMACAIDPAQPQFGSRGLGGTESPAPGISTVAGSLQAHPISRSTMISCVLGPAACRKCFKIVMQYSSAQSWSTWHKRKTDMSSSRAGCGSKKFWAQEPEHRHLSLRNIGWNATYLATSRVQSRVRRACFSSNTMAGYNVRHISYFAEDVGITIINLPLLHRP